MKQSCIKTKHLNNRCVFDDVMEKTLFVRFLGDSPRIRVLDMLITGRELDYSISDIASQAGIGRATFYRMLDELVKSRVIVATRRMGNMQLYRINTENKSVRDLVRLYDRIAKASSEKEVRRQLVKAIH